MLMFFRSHANNVALSSWLRELCIDKVSVAIKGNTEHQHFIEAILGWEVQTQNFECKSNCSSASNIN